VSPFSGIGTPALGSSTPVAGTQTPVVTEVGVLPLKKGNVDPKA
jgi:hypothetical protein